MNAQEAYDAVISIADHMDGRGSNYNRVKALIYESVGDGWLTTGYRDPKKIFELTSSTITLLEREGYRVVTYPSGAWEVFWNMAK
jgi:hypothetical protein